jgi:NAD-dependent dihydropyrimidine dehydrogenase PreA subunit
LWLRFGAWYPHPPPNAIRSGGLEVLPGAGGDTINVYTIKQESCVGCNLCSLVCPVEGCITMKEVETGKPRLSWNEYQALLSEGRMEKIPPPEHV